MAALPQVNYEQLEAERLAIVDHELVKELESRSTTGGAHNTLRQVILRLVISGDYLSAEDEITAYMAFRSEFPSFIFRSQRYVEHCKDIIHAIRAKRKFPGLQSMSISKQQELHDKVIEHFDELKDYLKQIEMVEREVRLDDMRSTVWVIQTLAQCILGVVMLALFLDLTNGMASSFVTVMDKLLNDGADWLVNLL